MKVVKDWEDEKIRVEFERKEYEKILVALMESKKLPESNIELWRQLMDDVFTTLVGFPIEDKEACCE